MFSQEYYGRVLYVIEHKGKWLMVYKSSGLSGTGHEGDILPFGFLNERESLRENIGYLFKEMFFNGQWVYHNKNLSRYGIINKMEDLKQFLLDTGVVGLPGIDESEENWSYEKHIEFVESINKQLRAFTSTMEPFDFHEDF